MPTQPQADLARERPRRKSPGNSSPLLAKAPQQHSGTRQPQCMKQQMQPRVVNTREQSSYTARRNKCNRTQQHSGTRQPQRTTRQTQPKTATPGNKAATMHEATNATENSNIWEQGSHNARRNKRNQKQQHPGTKQLQRMMQQMQPKTATLGNKAATMQDATNATKNSNTREQSSHNA